MSGDPIPTYCPLCVSRCGALATVEDGKLLALQPDPSHPTGKALCVKGKAAPQIIEHDRRLLHPMRRTNPKDDPDPGWEQITWDEALDTITQRLLAIKAADGPEAVAFSSSSPSTSAISDAVDWVVRLVRAFGSPNYSTYMELCGWGRYLAPLYTFGAPVPGTYLPDLDNAGCILFWGYNPSVARLAHATSTAAAVARGAKLIVVDPRKVGLAAKADHWLRVRPGTDGALALSMTHVMIENGWYDDAFVSDWTNAGDVVDGVKVWELLARHCGAYRPEVAEEITGVPAADIVAATRTLWESRPLAFYTWSGLEQHSSTTQTMRAINVLYALTGCLDVPGGNVLFDAVPANRIDGIELVSRDGPRTVGVAERPLGPARFGYATGEDTYTAALDGRIKAMVGFGGNPVMAYGDSARGRDALRSLDFFVQADLFMTPTAELADIVLPVTTPFESEALKIGFELSQEAQSLVQLRRPLVPPRGEARSDLQIVFELATRLGLGEHFWDGDIDAAYRHQLEPSGIPLEELRAHPEGVRVPLTTRHRKYVDRRLRHAVRQGRALLRARSPSTATRRCRRTTSRSPARGRGRTSPSASRWCSAAPSRCSSARPSTGRSRAFARASVTRRSSCTRTRRRRGGSPRGTGSRSTPRRAASGRARSSTPTSIRRSSSASTAGGRRARSWTCPAIRRTAPAVPTSTWC